jgi:hypothetical protein
MKSRDYELLVREIFQQLLNQDYVPNIVVEYDVEKEGRSTSHQIDVYWEFKLGGIIHRVVVQAKDWAKPVDQGELLKFKAVLSDLPGQPRGIVVTAQGYQQGALQVAAAHGIKIYELTEEAPGPNLQLIDVGWVYFRIKGYQRAESGHVLGFIGETEIITPEFSNLHFNVDRAWVREYGPIPPTSHILARPHELEFYDANQQFVQSLREIYGPLAKQVAGRRVISSKESHIFDTPTFLKLPFTATFLKVTGFSVDVFLKSEKHERLWKDKNVALFILKSLDDGEIRRFAQIRQD